MVAGGGRRKEIKTSYTNELVENVLKREKKG